MYSKYFCLLLIITVIIIGCEAGKTAKSGRRAGKHKKDLDETIEFDQDTERERDRGRDRKKERDTEEEDRSDEEENVRDKKPKKQPTMRTKKHDCVLRLNKDFGDPSPVFVVHNTLLTVNDKKGLIRLRFNDTVVVACPGKSRLLVLGYHIHKYDEAEATCMGYSKFRVGKYWSGQFKDIECNSNPYLKIEKTEEECIGKNYIYRIGFEVGDKFHNLYRACYDSDLGTTLYVHHALSPNTVYRQIGGRRPYFTKESVVFGKVRMANVYKISSQRKRIDALLNEDTNGKFVNDVNHLHRLQLAPRYDFVMRVAQRAAFTYINTAPQWNHITKADWTRLERGVRRRAHELNTTLMIYTGTYGIWTPEGMDKKGHQIYLSFRRMENVQRPFVPVPQYIYKLVYNSCEMKATAFVSINMPTCVRSLLEPKVFCKNICDGNKNSDFHWLKWQHKHSLSFCCNYDDFIKEINNLPKLEVRGIFY